MKKVDPIINANTPKKVSVFAAPESRPTFDPIIESKVNPSPQLLASKSIQTSVSQKTSGALVPRFYSGDVRAFETINDAKIAFDKYIHENDIKLEFSAEKGFDYKIVFQAIILCKFLSTVKWLFNDFKHEYNAIYAIKTFWKKTTWQVRYNKPTFTFEISTGCNNNGILQSGTYRNQNIDMVSYLAIAISDYIYKAQYSVPKARMDDFLKASVDLSKVRKAGEIDTYMLP